MFYVLIELRFIWVPIAYLLVGCEQCEPILILATCLLVRVGIHYTYILYTRITSTRVWYITNTRVHLVDLIFFIHQSGCKLHLSETIDRSTSKRTVYFSDRKMYGFE